MPTVTSASAQDTSKVVSLKIKVETGELKTLPLSYHAGQHINFSIIGAR